MSKPKEHVARDRELAELVRINMPRLYQLLCDVEREGQHRRSDLVAVVHAHEPGVELHVYRRDTVRERFAAKLPLRGLDTAPPFPEFTVLAVNSAADSAQVYEVKHNV